MIKLILATSISLLSLCSFADTSELEFITNLPDTKTQVGFANASDRRAFIKRFQSHSYKKKILDLSNLRFADLNYDQCLNSDEYQMFLIADTLWMRGTETARETQLRAFMNDYWIYAMYSGNKEEFYSALTRVKKDLPLDMLYVLWNSVVLGKWQGADKIISHNEVVFFEKSWNNFIKAPSNEINHFLKSKLKTIGKCKTLPGPAQGKTVVSPLESAKEIASIIGPQLNTLTTIDQWTGKAGTASFFGALYGKTKDSNYMAQSLKLFDEIEKEFLNGSHDSTLTMGSTGIGLSALYAYKVSGEQKFLDIALRFGKLSTLNSGNDYAEGSTGIGIFKLNLYLVTKDSAWLKEAEVAGDLIVKNAHVSGIGAFWPMTSDFPAVFAGFGHGSAGIGYYLIHLYQLTKKEIYKTYAYKAAEHVINTAYKDEKGNYHWTWYQPAMGYAQAWKYQWSHGNFGILYFFNSLRRFTPERKWEEAFNRTMAPALEKGIEYRFDEGNQCCGKAGQGDLYLTLYRETGEAKYLSLAKNAANYLVNPEGRVKDSYGRNKNKYDMSYSGIAGIGLFFLQLDEPSEGSLPYQIYEHE